jgi:hypothetical protein
MKLVHFTTFDGKSSISFIADKIVAFHENARYEDKTSIIISTGENSEEFIVGDNYAQVNSIMEKI